MNISLSYRNRKTSCNSWISMYARLTDEPHRTSPENPEFAERCPPLA